MTDIEAKSIVRLTALPAGNGDCLLIEYGTSEAHLHAVVIDCGVGTTAAKAMAGLLTQKPEMTLDLLVVSHVDGDHISGALTLLRTPGLATRFGDIWFNGFDMLPTGNYEALGYKQGDALSKFIQESALPWNGAHQGGPVMVEAGAGALVPTTLPGGAKITLLSPTREKLVSLREEWKAHRDVVEAEEPQMLESTRGGLANGLERLGGGLNVNKLAAEPTKPDDSKPNGSSIAFIFEFGGHELLLAADAHADVLLESGSRLTGGLPHEVNVFKLPHHGSKRNVSTLLVEAFPAQTYVVSTNGAGHNHPDDVALARIAVLDTPYNLLFNYEGESSSRWASWAASTAGRVAVRTAPEGQYLKLESSSGFV